MLGIDPLVVVFGFGVGVLIGLTGIGGGSIMTPLLILVVGVKPVVAIGTDLAYGAVTKTVGGWRHLRKGTVDLGLSAWLAFGSIPGALLGVWALARVRGAYGESFDSLLLSCVAGTLLLASVASLGRALFMPKHVAGETEKADLGGVRKAWAVAIGLLLGVVVGLTSVGSGALIGVLLILVFRLTPHRVVGTDVFHAAILLWVCALAHLLSGNVDLGLAANILLGSVPGVWIGTQVIGRVPGDGLRPALACVLLGSALGVASKAGAEVPVAAIVGAPLIVGIAAYLLHRSRRDESVDHLSAELTMAR